MWFAECEGRPLIHQTSEACRQSGVALQFASAGLQGVREVALAAVKQNGMALEFVAGDFHQSFEFVQVAVEEKGLA